MDEGNAQLVSRSPLLDRRFIAGVLVVSVAYVAIVTAIGKWFGKEAAGIAGVTLTALATAILKQFESMRFKVIGADSDEIAIRLYTKRDIFLVLLILIGCDDILGIFFDSSLNMIKSRLFTVEEFGGMHFGLIAWSDNVKYLLIVTVILGVKNFCAGLIVSRLLPGLAWRLVASSLTLLLVGEALLSILRALVYNMDRTSSTGVNYVSNTLQDFGVFAFLILLTTLIGVWTGTNRQKRPAAPHDG